MLTVKYNRTSTIQQKGERFKLDKENYDLTINDFGVSGKIPFNKREGGARLMKLIEENKVSKVVFEDASRIGRTLKDSINTLSYLTEEKNILVKIRNIGIESHTPDGKPNSIWKLITSILLSVYDMERDRILELTENGRKQYVLNGGKLGRPMGWKQSDKKFLEKPQTKSIMRLLKMGKSVRDIKDRLKCSPNTITKVKKLMKSNNCNEENHIEETTSNVSNDPPTIVVEKTFKQLQAECNPYPNELCSINDISDPSKKKPKKDEIKFYNRWGSQLAQPPKDIPWYTKKELKEQYEIPLSKVKTKRKVLEDGTVIVEINGIWVIDKTDYT